MAQEDLRSRRKKAIRDKIQASIDAAKEQNRRDLMRRRIELARTGLKCYTEKKYPEAVKAFVTYIRILEDWKGLASGGLHPSSFDAKRDVAELLLINNVYWHLVKLYDQTGFSKTGKTTSEFSHYLQKFVLFTKGQPFAPLSGETLRKYIKNTKLRHPKDFKIAYKTITGAKCFVATALVDVTEDETLARLRTFRDQRLRKTKSGRWLIATYYKVGPYLATATDYLPASVRKVMGLGLDLLSKKSKSLL